MYLFNLHKNKDKKRQELFCIEQFLSFELLLQIYKR